MVLGKDQGVCEETALLGYMRADDNGRVVNQIFEPVYLNVHKPFVMCVCGRAPGKVTYAPVVLGRTLSPWNGRQQTRHAHEALVMHYDQ